MKKIISIIILATIAQSGFAKKFEFKLLNTTAFPIQVSIQLIKGIEKENPEFLFVLKPNESREFTYKVKNNEKLKFMGIGAGVETLPLVKSYNILSLQIRNEPS